MYHEWLMASVRHFDKLCSVHNFPLTSWKMYLYLLTILLSMAAQGASGDVLTAEGLRAWVSSGGMLEANSRLIHSQMQQQRASLPPWWPDDVYAQEEDAIQKVDFIGAALPFYQDCLSEREARLLVKFSLSKAGQQVTKTSVETHSQAAERGASPVAAQSAGEDAGTRAAASISSEERQAVAASLTPAERTLAAEAFNPVKTAALRQCTDKAFAETAGVMKARQEEALRAVIEANRPALVAAQEKWEKKHPGIMN